MIKTNYHAQQIGLAILTGIIGMSPLVSLPVLAQVDSYQPFVKKAEAYGSAASSGASPSVTAQRNTAPAKNLVQLAEESSSFKTLLRAGQEAGLLNTLAGKGPYTVFAPTDEAIAELPQGAVEAALKPENRTLLRQILLYHVVPGRVTSSQLKTGTVKTLGGGVSVRKTPDRIIVNNGSVIQPNIQASNGVAHVINTVLIPKEIREKYAAQPTAQQ